MEALMNQLGNQHLHLIPAILLHVWIRAQTFRALISGVCGKNTDAIHNLVVLHQVVLDFLPDDHSAAYWIQHHLVSIIARMEPHIGFDVVAGLLSGFLMDSPQALDRYQQVQNGLQRINGQRRFKQISSFTSDPERQAWVAFYVGCAAASKNKAAISIKWFQRSLDLACSDELKFVAGEHLGKLYLRSSFYDPIKAVKLYRVSKDAAVELGARDFIASGMYKLGRALIEADEFGEAHEITKQLASTIGERDDGNSRVTSLLEGLPVDVEETQKDFLVGKLIQNAPWPSRVSDTATMLLDAWDQLCMTETDPSAAARAHFEHRKLQKRLRGARDDAFDKVRFLKAASKFHLQRGRLALAEANAAELLKLADRISLPYSKVLALLFLVDICTKYHEESKDESGDECFQVVKSLLDEAETLARPHPRLLSMVLLEQGLNYNRSGRFVESAQKFEEDARKLMEVDEKFGGFNVGRVVFKDTCKTSIQLLCQTLARHPNPERRQDALIWGEREKCRDLLYNIRNLEQRDRFLRDMREFDRDENAAWEEIKEITRLAGEDTIILVLNISSSASCVLSWLLQWDFKDSELLYGGHSAKIKEATGYLSAPHGELFRNLVQKTVDCVRSGGDSGELLNILQLWYTLCIEPWESALQQRKPKKLVIIPHQELCVLPFSALYSADRKFLVQKYAISIAPSLRMYKQCMLQQQTLASTSERNSADALVIGNPSLGGVDHDLPFAQVEANYVTEKLQLLGLNVTQLQRAEATKAAAMALVVHKSWIHIASHAIVDETYPYGALLLGSDDEPSSETAASSKEERRDPERLRSIFEKTPGTGMLTGQDLETVSSLDAMAVVLSACSTGLGRIYSEGVLGLTRWFHMLGVPSVVASLWNVDDSATKVLMERFYSHLETGLDVASALQSAVIEMIEDTDELGYRNYEPYHWAAFIVCGADATSFPCSF